MWIIRLGTMRRFMYKVYDYVTLSIFIGLKKLQWADHIVMLDDSRVPTNVMRGCCAIRRQYKREKFGGR
jgi:hypothetical protein